MIISKLVFFSFQILQELILNGKLKSLTVKEEINVNYLYLFFYIISGLWSCQACVLKFISHIRDTFSLPKLQQNCSTSQCIRDNKMSRICPVTLHCKKLLSHLSLPRSNKTEPVGIDIDDSDNIESNLARFKECLDNVYSLNSARIMNLDCSTCLSTHRKWEATTLENDKNLSFKCDSIDFSQDVMNSRESHSNDMTRSNLVTGDDFPNSSKMNDESHQCYDNHMKMEDGSYGETEMSNINDTASLSGQDDIDLYDEALGAGDGSILQCDGCFEGM